MLTCSRHRHRSRSWPFWTTLVFFHWLGHDMFQQRPSSDSLMENSHRVYFWWKWTAAVPSCTEQNGPDRKSGSRAAQCKIKLCADDRFVYMSTDNDEPSTTTKAQRSRRNYEINRIWTGQQMWRLPLLLLMSRLLPAQLTLHPCMLLPHFNAFQCCIPSLMAPTAKSEVNDRETTGWVLMR